MHPVGRMGRPAYADDPARRREPEGDVARAHRPEHPGMIRARRDTTGRLADPAEPIVPWLAAAVVVGLCYLATITIWSTGTQDAQAALVVVLAGTLAASGLLAARATREVLLSDLDEWARPVPDELSLIDEGELLTRPSDEPSYLVGMQHWTSALLELLNHAAAETTDSDLARQLSDAAADTQAMHELLASKDPGELSLGESAMLHTIATIWEAGQLQHELVAAEIDQRWYRRWYARTIVERRLRHGVPRTRSTALPYG